MASLLGGCTALIVYLSVALWIWTFPKFYASPDPASGRRRWLAVDDWRRRAVNLEL